MKETNPSHPNRYLIRYGIVAFFLLPFLFFAWKFRFQIELNFSELWWALKNSVYQSTLAGFFVMLLAVPMSFGLASLPVGWRLMASRLLLLPQILPVLFTVLIVFTIVNPFPMGSAGIIILFSVVNLGLATVLIEQAATAKLSSLAVTAEVYSVSRIKFLTKIYFPLMFADLMQIFFLVFVFCMSSFSIPLLAGDGRAVNLEILVFEKVFIDNNWAAGFGVSLVQTFFVFGMSALMLESAGATGTLTHPNLQPSRLLRSKNCIVLIAAFLGLYVTGYVYGIAKSFTHLNFIANYASEILAATMFSLKCLLAFVFLNFCLLYLCLWDQIKSRRLNPALHFISLSTVVAGFSVYLFFPTSPDYDLVKLLLAASVLLFAPLFKLFLQGPIEGLNRQLQIAEVYGLPPSTVIIDIIIRQLHGAFFLWMSVLCVWFSSDYAISRAVGLQTQTLGLVAQGFLSSYRMQASFLMSLLIIIFSVLVLIVLKFLAKAAYVAYKKSHL
ncbi:MAG: thiamine transport system permease protein ThiP [Pseudobdellovibrio sp.]|nr:thiamine transport system permease protein ThiP [Pseudobdellovibrio sp.]